MIIFSLPQCNLVSFTDICVHASNVLPNKVALHTILLDNKTICFPSNLLDRPNLTYLTTLKIHLPTNNLKRTNQNTNISTSYERGKRI